MKNSHLLSLWNFPYFDQTQIVRQSQLRHKLTLTYHQKYDQISENHVIQSRYVRVFMSLWFFISRSSHITKQKRKKKKTECKKFFFIEHSHVETGVKWGKMNNLVCNKSKQEVETIAYIIIKFSFGCVCSLRWTFL